MAANIKSTSAKSNAGTNTVAMDEKLKEKWLKALRSGKYKQCTLVLRKNGAYCCLGVLHKIALRKEPPTLWGGTPKILSFLDTEYVDGSRLAAKLGRMNDMGKNFHEIADYIEATL